MTSVTILEIFMSQLSAWALLSGKLNKLHCGDTGAPMVTWHTYTPWSRWLTNLMARVQSFSPGVCLTVNLSSWTCQPWYLSTDSDPLPTWVNVFGPVLRMCQSRRRIQDTCSNSQRSEVCFVKSLIFCRQKKIRPLDVTDYIFRNKNCLWSLLSSH